MARIVLALALLMAALAPAWADPAIDKSTKCQAVVGYLDRKDSPHAQEAYRAAKQMMPISTRPPPPKDKPACCSR